MIRGLIREPLVHFAALAALVFAAYQAAGTKEAGPERVIRLSADDLARLAALYRTEAGVPPGEAELKRILSEQIEARALAAEARRLGLDQGDVVVERRLAQKMRFTLSDGGEIAPPDEETLRRWVAANAERFARKPRYSFDQIYFKDAGDPRLTAARAALSPDAETSETTDWRGLGDPFMLSRQAGELPLREIARRFGADFANRIAPLEPDQEWRGPIPSAFGAHLVRVTAKIGGEAPPFEAIREEAERLWMEEERRRRSLEAVADLVGRYRVEIAGGEPAR